jgi:hypothetical protein
MKRATLASLLAACFFEAALAADAGAITRQEAHAIGVDAYLYLYPLVSMDITRRQQTNALGPSIDRGPMGTFINAPSYPPVDVKLAFRLNLDTLYSAAWLDLTSEPMIVSAPDTNGRYYLLPMLDMWTDVFASPGWRTTGTGAHSWAIVPPGWTGMLPDGVERINAPTPYVWITGRTQVDGPADYDAVHKIQAGYKITPLSQWGKTPAPPSGTIDPSVDMKTPTTIKVDTMPADVFFAYAAELLKVNPPHVTDQPIIAQLKKLGFEIGKSFDLDKAEPTIRDALATAPEDGRQLIEWMLPKIAPIVNGWLMITTNMGVYGNWYLKRAGVAKLSLGANLPEDAIYPLNLGDESGDPLNGANNYVLHFDKGASPPANAFWSLTLYDGQGFRVANPLNRFKLSSRMTLKYNADGSLDLYLQNETPGMDKEANWLPAPRGPFAVTLRLYAPGSEALTGKWNPPPVKRVQ